MAVNPTNRSLVPVAGDNDAREFLPAALEIMETPPKPLGRILAIVIATFFLCLTVWAAVSPIDIVAVAQGRVVPAGQIKVVQPFQAGTVSHINVREGDHVEKGQILVQLRATEAETDRERVTLDLARARLEEAMATALMSDDPVGTFQAPLEIDAQFALLSQTVVSQRWQSHRSALQDNLLERQRLQSALEASSTDEVFFTDSLSEFEALGDTANKLDDLGLATNSQVANIQLQLISARSKLQNAQQSSRQLELDIERNKAQREQMLAQYLDEANTKLSEARQAIMTAELELARLRQREELHLLRAPVSGVVNDVIIHTIGAVVSPAERLITIVPDDAVLEVEAVLENRDIGFVEEGQDAELKLDAFPFTRYGVVNAKVTQISADATVDEQRGAIYAVRLTPNMASLDDAKDVRLSPGMRVTAEIKTGDRTVLEYLMTPLLRYRDEAIRER